MKKKNGRCLYFPGHSFIHSLDFCTRCSCTQGQGGVWEPIPAVMGQRQRSILDMAPVSRRATQKDKHWHSCTLRDNSEVAQTCGLLPVLKSQNKILQSAGPGMNGANSTTPAPTHNQAPVITGVKANVQLDLKDIQIYLMQKHVSILNNCT